MKDACKSPMPTKQYIVVGKWLDKTDQPLTIFRIAGIRKDAAIHIPTK